MARTLLNREPVLGMAQTFETTGDVLDAIIIALEVAIAALHATAFFTFGASEAQALWLTNIKKKAEKLAALSHETGKELNNAVKFYETGDAQYAGMYSSG
jgi:hypothetical protein